MESPWMQSSKWREPTIKQRGKHVPTNGSFMGPSHIDCRPIGLQYQLRRREQVARYDRLCYGLSNLK